MRWSVGIDPGFVETGIVLMKHESNGRRLVAYKTMSCPTNGSNFKRTEALSTEIVAVIESWIDRFDIAHLDIGIETPIYANNAHSFELQWRLLQEIESMLSVMSMVIDDLWLTEVGPSASKKLATGKGDADKMSVYKYSPFDIETVLVKDVFKHRSKEKEVHTLYTLGDAWAHSLATWGGCKDCNRIEASDWNLPTVKYIAGGDRDGTEARS